MKIIDMRSDTVTQPTSQMREAMAIAPVGDDVYGDDPSVIELEEVGAKMAGKEAALFVPSGTFGNQLSIFTHCGRGEEIIVGETNHIITSEAGAAAVIAGVQTRTVDVVKGIMDLEKIEQVIRKDDDLHHPKTALICVENAHSSGHAMPVEHMKEVYELAKKYDIPVHCDGARIFNAATALGTTAVELLSYTDSASICLSKGLCAPIGSIVVGSREFIDKARRKRKIMGGGMRQAGILAAAGVIALKYMSVRLEQDHKNAKQLAEMLEETNGLVSHPEDVQINMAFFDYVSEKVSPLQFAEKLKAKGILINAPVTGKLRLATHFYVKGEDIDYIVTSIKEALN